MKTKFLLACFLFFTSITLLFFAQSIYACESDGDCPTGEYCAGYIEPTPDSNDCGYCPGEDFCPGDDWNCGGTDCCGGEASYCPSYDWNCGGTDCCGVEYYGFCFGEENCGGSDCCGGEADYCPSGVWDCGGSNCCGGLDNPWNCEGLCGDADSGAPGVCTDDGSYCNTCSDSDMYCCEQCNGGTFSCYHGVCGCDYEDPCAGVSCQEDGCYSGEYCSGSVCDGSGTCSEPSCYPTVECGSETCSDGILNQDEIDVDCGGSSCPACAGLALKYYGIDNLDLYYGDDLNYNFGAYLYFWIEDFYNPGQLADPAFVAQSECYLDILGSSLTTYGPLTINNFYVDFPVGMVMASDLTVVLRCEQNVFDESSPLEKNGNLLPPLTPEPILSGSECGPIMVDWTSTPRTGAEGYDIYRSVNGGAVSFASSTVETYFEDSDLVAGAEYYYEVRPYINDLAYLGSGGTSTPKIISSSCGFGSPQELEVANDCNPLAIRWTPVFGAESYEVSVENIGVRDGVFSESNGYIYFSDYNPLPLGLDYVYKVKALDGNGNTAFSTTSLSVLSGCPMKPDINFGQYSCVDSSIRLDWNNSGEIFNIYKNGNTNRLNTNELFNSEYIDSGPFTQGETISYQLESCFSGGRYCSDKTNLSLTIPSCSSVATSTCLVSQNNSNGKIYVNREVKWEATSTSVNIPLYASTTWSGKDIAPTPWRASTILNKIYTTVGLKTINATSTWFENGVEKTATCSTSTNVILGNDIIKEI